MASCWAPATTAGNLRLANFRVRTDYFQNWRMRVDVYYVDPNDHTIVRRRSNQLPDDRCPRRADSTGRDGGAAGQSQAGDCLCAATGDVMAAGKGSKGDRRRRQGTGDRGQGTGDGGRGRTGVGFMELHGNQFERGIRRMIRMRRGLTLAELLVATSIMLMIATAIGTLAATVQTTNSFCQGYTVSAQHARVVLSRIERTVQAATASEQFPGLIVVPEQAGGQELPSTLVVWSPTSAPANPTGLPLISEIVVFARPGASQSARRNPLANRGDRGARGERHGELAQLDGPFENQQFDGQNCADLPAADGAPNGRLYRFAGAGRPPRRGAVSAAHGSYGPGLEPISGRHESWQDLNWPLDSYRSTSGTRAVACQTELQMAPAACSQPRRPLFPFMDRHRSRMNYHARPADRSLLAQRAIRCARPSKRRPLRRRGIAVVLVLGLLAITLAISYATLRGQGVTAQLVQNNSRALDARVAAQSGLAAASAKSAKTPGPVSMCRSPPM